MSGARLHWKRGRQEEGAGVSPRTLEWVGYNNAGEPIARVVRVQGPLSLGMRSFRAVALDDTATVVELRPGCPPDGADWLACVGPQVVGGRADQPESDPRRRGEAGGRKGPAARSGQSDPHGSTFLTESNIRTGLPVRAPPDGARIGNPFSEGTEPMQHVTIEPGILYFGTPVVLISTINEDGSFNLAPMSSAFWLGLARCVLGLSATSKTPQNMVRTRASAFEPAIRRFGRYGESAGSDHGIGSGAGSEGAPLYRHEPDKFGISEFTAMASPPTVVPPRVHDCPVQLGSGGQKDELHRHLPRMTRCCAGGSALLRFAFSACTWTRQSRWTSHPNRIDPVKWRPLILSFQEFYGLGSKVHSSRLGTVPEALYRGPDIERARSAGCAMAAE